MELIAVSITSDSVAFPKHLETGEVLLPFTDYQTRMKMVIEGKMIRRYFVTVIGLALGLIATPVFAEDWNRVLLEASRKGLYNEVEQALERGADIQAINSFGGMPPLTLAAEGGHLQVVALLLSEGAKINVENAFGRTALTAAIWRDQQKVVEFLVKKGAQINFRSNGQFVSIPIIVAALNNRLEIAKTLIAQGADVNLHEVGGMSALGEAVRGGHTKMAALLLDHGADPNIKMAGQLDVGAFKERSPLMIAASNGFYAIAQALIMKGANVNAKDERGNTALSLAAKADQVEIAQLLLDAKASPETEVESGFTPLALAAMEGNMELVELLLRAGANPNYELSHHGVGGTALHFAAAGGYQDVVALLLKGGAAVDVRNRDGETPLIKAASLGYGGADRSGLGVVQLLISKGADVNAVSKRGKSALIAATHGSEKTVEFLLKNGADVNILDGYQKDALYDAVDHCRASIVSRLIRAGADLKRRYFLVTALMHAVERCDDTQTVEALIAEGVDVNNAGAGGRTPLDLAENAGRTKTAALLRSRGARNGTSTGNGLEITSPREGDNFIEGDTVKVTVKPTKSPSELAYVTFFIAIPGADSPCMREFTHPHMSALSSCPLAVHQVYILVRSDGLQKSLSYHSMSEFPFKGRPVSF